METTAGHEADVDERSVRCWAESAEAVGAPRLAGDLLAAEHLVDEVELARLALRDRRPADALALLTRAGRDLVPAAGPGSPEHVVALAVRAAQGDEDALRALVAFVSTVTDSSARGRFLRLLADAAHAAGRHDLADAAWTSLVVEHGDRTPQALAGWAAAVVAARSRTRSADAVDSVLGAADVLRRAVPAAADDAAATTRAVRDLQRRGDDTGAALLAAAVARSGRPSADLRALRDETALRGRRAPATVPWLVAVVLLPLGVVGIALGVAVVQVLRRRWRRFPGVSLSDEEVWLGVDGIRLDDGRQTGAHSEVRPVPALAAVVGFGAGIALAAELNAWVGSLVPDLGEGWAMMLWAVPLLGTPVLAFVLVDGVRRVVLRRQLVHAEVADRAARLRAAGSCRCWDSSVNIGPFADAYASEHLVVTAQPAGVVEGAEVRRCPLSGVPWLVTVTTDGHATLALRGAPPIPTTSPAPPGTSGYL